MLQRLFIVKSITDNQRHVGSLVPVTEEVQASRWLSDLRKVRRSTVGLSAISMESLILAQDERWRRA